MLKLLYQPLVVAIITLLTLILCVSLYLSSTQLRSSSQKVAALQADVAKEQVVRDQLAEKLNETQKPSSQEKIIRDELLMQKPGELVVQMPELPAVTVEPAVSEERQSAWEEWRKLLF